MAIIRLDTQLFDLQSCNYTFGFIERKNSDHMFAMCVTQCSMLWNGEFNEQFAKANQFCEKTTDSFQLIKLPMLSLFLEEYSITY